MASNLAFISMIFGLLTIKQVFSPILHRECIINEASVISLAPLPKQLIARTAPMGHHVEKRVPIFKIQPVV